MCFLWIHDLHGSFVKLLLDECDVLRYLVNIQVFKTSSELINFDTSFLFVFSKVQIRIDDFKKFIYYCLYAFGVPLTFCIVVFIIDFWKFAHKEFLPGIGVERCWIQKGRMAEAIYVYGPITVILVINTAFCAFTAFKIFKAQKKTSGARQNRQNADQER